MDPRVLFLRTLEDLEERIQPGRDEYDLLMVAALLRKLLLDAEPLVVRVNRTHRLRLRFRANKRFPPQNPTPMIWSVQDGFDPDTGVPGLANPVDVKIDELLQLPVAYVEGHLIRVGSLIRYLSHVAGAVHAGRPENDLEEAIQRFAVTVQIGGPMSAPVRSLMAIGRVVLAGLAPLREAVATELS